MPVHNRREITLQCLRSLSRIVFGSIRCHIIVVDDGSTDGTADAIASQFPGVQVIHGDGNLWYTAGTNVGIQAAIQYHPDYILAINDDSIFDRECVRRLVECAEDNVHSVVGALLCDWDDPNMVFQVAPVWDTWYGGWRHRKKLTRGNVGLEPFSVELIVGNCTLYPAAAIREAGLMDERGFPFGFGDAEYTPRMRKLGWRLLIEPRAIVYCQPNTLRPSLRSRTISDLIRILLLDQRAPENLWREFIARWKSAPSRLQGMAAFAVCIVRLTLKAMKIGGSWPEWPDPRTAWTSSGEMASHRCIQQ